MKTFSEIFKLIILFLAVFVLFIFAYNGRYIYVNGQCVIDKWKGVFIVLPVEDLSQNKVE